MKGKKEKYDVFLSYRRAGGTDTAMLICAELRRRRYRVFMDVDSLRSGPFDEKLYEIIDNCKDFLLILPPNALDRCENEDDWVRLEIERAHKSGKNIIPIMLNGFQWPDKLPESIEFIKIHTGLPPATEYFNAFIDRLCEFLHSKPAPKWIAFAAAALAIAVLVALPLLWRPVPPSELLPSAPEPLPSPAEALPSPVAESALASEKEIDAEGSVEQLQRFIGDIGDFQQLHFSSSYESSSLDAESTAANTIDGNTKTAWIEGSEGSGIDEFAVLRFDKMTRVDLVGIGTAETSETEKLLRPKRIEIRFSEGETVWCSIPNESRQILFALEKPVHTKYILVMIKDVWPETGSENTAVSEVSAYALRGPSAKDLEEIDAKITFPGETEYFETYREAFINAPGGYSVYGYYKPTRAGEKKEIRKDERVTVLAERGDMSCVIVQSSRTAWWVNSDYLKEINAPSAADLDAINAQIRYPRKESFYLNSYVYTNVNRADCQVFLDPNAKDVKAADNWFTVDQGESVIILAKSGEYACVIFPDLQKAGWINEKYLNERG